MYIAIDPSYSKPIGIAWSYDGSDIYFNSISIDKEDLKPDTRDFFRIAKKVLKFIKEEIKLTNDENNTVAIESQFFGKNAAMAIGLISVRRLVQGAVMVRYPKVKQVSVDPRSWQAKVLHVSRMASKDIKPISIKNAEALTKKKPTEDEADAINILEYIVMFENKL